MSRVIAAAAAVLLCSVIGCRSAAEPRVVETPSPPSAPRGGVVLRFGHVHLRAEVAATADARARGLMHRSSLADDSGMIFLFPQRANGGFWMKNTLIPLSIAFMDRTGEGSYRVVEILDMQPCRADPCRTYRPTVAYDAAVEASLGWFTRHDITRGTTAEVVAGEEPVPA